MQAARQHFLAGAAFAQQHHGGVAGGDFFDRTAHLQHARVAGHQAGQRIGRLHGLQALVLGLQLGQPESALDREVEQLGLEGLGEEVVGAQRHRPQRVGLVVLAGEHDDLDVRVGGQHLLEQPEALGDGVRVGRQAEVHGDHGGVAAAHLHQRRFAVVRGDRLETVERPLDLFLERQVVFDDQQRARFVSAHEAPRGCRSECRWSSKSGSSTVTMVPRLTSLSTVIFPPNSCTY